MNKFMMAAFYDELEKIADWALTGEAIPQIAAEQIKQRPVTEAPLTVNADLQRHIKAKEDTIRAQELASEQHAARVEELLRSGQLNPATHFVDRAGNIVPNKPIVAPRTEAPTRVTPPPLAPTGAVGPEGTNILGPTGTPDKRLPAQTQPRQPTQVTRVQGQTAPAAQAAPTRVAPAQAPLEATRAVAPAATEATRAAKVFHAPPPTAARGGTSIIRRVGSGASRAPGKMGLLGKGLVGAAALGTGALIGSSLSGSDNRR